MGTANLSTRTDHAACLHSRCWRCDTAHRWLFPGRSDPRRTFLHAWMTSLSGDEEGILTMPMALSPPRRRCHPTPPDACPVDRPFDIRITCSEHSPSGTTAAARHGCGGHTQRSLTWLSRPMHVLSDPERRARPRSGELTSPSRPASLRYGLGLSTAWRIDRSRVFRAVIAYLPMKGERIKLSFPGL